MVARRWRRRTPSRTVRAWTGVVTVRRVPAAPEGFVPHRIVALLLAALFTLAAPAARAATAAPAGPPAGVGANFGFEPLGGGVFAVIRRDPPGLMCDGNCVVIENDSDVVVVDAPESSREVIAAIRARTHKPVSAVIDTHWHDDHVTGNGAYRAAWPGVAIIAHESVAAYLAGKGVEARRQMLHDAPEGAEMLRGLLAKGRSLTGDSLDDEERASYRSDVALVEHYLEVVPGAPLVPPTVPVHERLVLRRGARTIEVLALGAGHTGGDLVVWLPHERIAVCGDLVVWPVPLVGVGQSHVRAWSASLDRLRALAPLAIVPGHGPVLRDDAHVRQVADLFRSVRAQVDAAVARGETLEETRRDVDLSMFRRAFAGASRVRRVLFGSYVTGPAVEEAYGEAVRGD
jgi:glyoxylase-like metal-dependent hydrolase (beta-lactamase superfamily II)